MFLPTLGFGVWKILKKRTRKHILWVYSACKASTCRARKASTCLLQLHAMWRNMSRARKVVVLSFFTGAELLYSFTTDRRC